MSFFQNLQLSFKKQQKSVVALERQAPPALGNKKRKLTMATSNNCKGPVSQKLLNCGG